MDINKKLFGCLESIIDNNTNITDEMHIIDNCSSFIGYGSEIGVYAFRSLSILGFISNFIFLIFQHLRIKKKKKQ